MLPNQILIEIFTRHADVVNKHAYVYLAEHSLYVIVLRLVEFCEVDFDCLSLDRRVCRLQLLRNCVELLLSAADQNDVEARFGEFEAICLSDAVRGAGYDDPVSTVQLFYFLIGF